MVLLGALNHVELVAQPAFINVPCVFIEGYFYIYYIGY